MEENIIENTVEVPAKRKRGRPKKEHPYSDFQDEIKEVFKSYIDDNKELIESFINSTKRIDKKHWLTIYNHVSDICNSLNTKNSYLDKFSDYSYRPDSMWRGLDEFRENQRKEFIKNFYQNIDLDLIYRSYMIFSHFKIYISESSKEMKV